jgi:hypothetical protein
LAELGYGIHYFEDLHGRYQFNKCGEPEKVNH